MPAPKPTLIAVADPSGMGARTKGCWIDGSNGATKGNMKAERPRR